MITLNSNRISISTESDMQNPNNRRHQTVMGIYLFQIHTPAYNDVALRRLALGANSKGTSTVSFGRTFLFPSPSPTSGPVPEAEGLLLGLATTVEAAAAPHVPSLTL